MSELDMREGADEKKLLSSLGLCARAGKVIFGVPMICEALRKGGKKSPVLIVEASDTSDNTHKRIADKAAYYKVRTVSLNCDGATLASALGKTSSLAAVAITDEQMCRMAEKYI
jgi:ribosomal protein L7Ae-like RNA K-turn-binding protein